MIRVPSVRLVDENGEALGIVETYKALAMAKERELDLVEVSPNAQPPVCKIIDWGKYQFQEAKKQQDAKTKQKKTEVKGMRLRPNIGENDLNTKIKQIEGFLEKGHRVKVEMILRGREKAFARDAEAKMHTFIDKLVIPVKIEQPIKRQPNGFNVLIAPDLTKKIEKKEENQEKLV